MQGVYGQFLSHVPDSQLSLLLSFAANDLSDSVILYGCHMIVISSVGLIYIALGKTSRGDESWTHTVPCFNEIRLFVSCVMSSENTEPPDLGAESLGRMTNVICQAC